MWWAMPTLQFSTILMHENRAEVSDFIAETIEDVAMEQAIVEGEATEIVSRESIFQLLERKV